MEDPRIEYTIKHEERKIAQAALATEAKKNKYIYDIKNGLGEEIKEEPNKPILVPSVVLNKLLALTSPATSSL